MCYSVNFLYKILFLYLILKFKLSKSLKKFQLNINVIIPKSFCLAPSPQLSYTFVYCTRKISLSLSLSLSLSRVGLFGKIILPYSSQFFLVDLIQLTLNLNIISTFFFFLYICYIPNFEFSSVE
jgi:hypothetical protein